MSASTKSSLIDVEVSAAEIPSNALRILDAAVKLFARKGYAATSVREIVQEAEVTNPMLYYYFDSKEGLFLFLTQLMQREFMKDLTQAIEGNANFEEALVEVAAVNMRGVRESPDALRFVYALLFGAEGSCPMNDLFESHRHVTAALESLLQRAIDSGQFVPAFDIQWLVLQFNGLINSHSMRLVKELEFIPEPERREWIDQQTDDATARRLVRFFLSGATKSEK